MRGSLRRRGDGRWQVRVFLGRDPTSGKVRLHERTIEGTKREAERVLAELISEFQGGSVVRDGGVTVVELLERWLEQNEADFSPKTVLEVRGFIKRTIAPAIGKHRVVDVSTADLDAFYQHLRKAGGVSGAGLAAATIRRVHGILRRAFTQAVRWGMIRHNPAVGATPPRVPKPEIHPPSPEQVAEIFSLALERRPDFATFVLLAASSGARRSELLAMRWSDVDFDTGAILISRGIVMSETGPVEKDTKTHQARRLSIDATTLASLKDQRRRHETVAAECGVEVSPSSYVFSREVDGSAPWRPDSMTRIFRELADQASAREVRLHDLRHYVATRLLGAGVDVRTVAGRLGHRDASTTLNVYSHFIPEADQKAAALLGGMLDGAIAARR